MQELLNRLERAEQCLVEVGKELLAVSKAVKEVSETATRLQALNERHKTFTAEVRQQKITILTAAIQMAKTLEILQFPIWNLALDEDTDTMSLDNPDWKENKNWLTRRFSRLKAESFVDWSWDKSPNTTGHEVYRGVCASILRNVRQRVETIEATCKVQRELLEIIKPDLEQIQKFANQKLNR